MNAMSKFQRSRVLFKSSLLVIIRNKGALYLYAAEGIIPAPYSQEMLDMAWKFKKS